jgi:hypothetical protein
VKRWKVALVTGLLSAVVAAGLEGCTAGSISAPTSAVDVTTAPGSAKSYVGARKDVQLSQCNAGEKGTRVTGKVTNPTHERQDYRIYVSIITTSRTLAVREVDVADVPAGGSRSWGSTLSATESDPTCVLRVERTTSA